MNEIYILFTVFIVLQIISFILTLPTVYNNILITKYNRDMRERVLERHKAEMGFFKDSKMNSDINLHHNLEKNKLEIEILKKELENKNDWFRKTKRVF